MSTASRGLRSIVMGMTAATLLTACAVAAPVPAPSPVPVPVPAREATVEEAFAAWPPSPSDLAAAARRNAGGGFAGSAPELRSPRGALSADVLDPLGRLRGADQAPAGCLVVAVEGHPRGGYVACPSP